MLELGTVIERYRIEAKLGEGGMAVVYRVRHETLDTLHALKVLTVTSGEVRRRLVQEGKVQASLRHPNIVSVTDVLDVDGCPGLLMEWVDGISLETLLHATELSLKENLAIFRGILAGVGHAHSEGLIHRDLKPANIMLQVGRERVIPKVADFGLAKHTTGMSDSQTRTGATMGTPAYMPPEQISDAGSVDRRADVYALGCILYEMLCGSTPFARENLLEVFVAVRLGTFTTASEINENVPPEIDACINAALKGEREERPMDVVGLLRLLEGHDAEEYAGDLLPKARYPEPKGPTSLPLQSEIGSLVQTLRDQHDIAAVAAVSHGPKTVETVVLDPAPDPAATSADLRLSNPTDDDIGVPQRSRRGMSMAILALLLGTAVIFGGLAAIGAVGLVGAIVTDQTDFDPKPLEQEQLGPDSDPQPGPKTEPAPEPAPSTEPEPGEPEPVPTEPVPTEPVPTEPVPSEPSPDPVPSAAPVPGPTPTPDPAPAPEPVPEAKGSVVTASGARTVTLQGSAGRFRAGEVLPPGSYTITATFDGVARPIKAGTVTVAGSAIHLICDAAFKRCRPQ